MSEAVQALRSVTPTKSPKDFYGEFHKTGRGTLGGTYLRQFWHPIERIEDLAPGRTKPIRILSEDFTLYRGEDGTPHLTQFRCPHRGTQLSVGLVEGDAIRCRYHGWKFGGAGVCVERPAEPSGPAGVKIRSYPAREYLGLIYAYFGEGEAPSFPPYPGFQTEGIIEIFRDDFPCNYFQSWENDWDLFHANWTHKTGEVHGPAAGAGRDNFYLTMMNSEKYEETDYGVVRRLKTVMGTTNDTVLLMPSTVRLKIPTFNEQARRSGNQLRESYICHTPIDDERHIAFLISLVQLTAEEVTEYKAQYEAVVELRKSLPKPHDVSSTILSGEKSLKDVVDYPILVAIEDHIVQGGQGKIANRFEEQLGRSDVGVIFLRRLMARELEALADGRPTKQWAYMAEMPEGLTVDTFDPTNVVRKS